MKAQVMKSSTRAALLLGSLAGLAGVGHAQGASKAQALRQIRNNPGTAKRVAVANHMDWCRTEDASNLRTETYTDAAGRVATRIVSCAVEGPPDVPANRNAAIPNASTPFKTLRVKFTIFALNDGTQVCGTQTQVDAQLNRLNLDYAPARIRFVSTGTRFVNSTRFRNPINLTTEVEAMKETYADQPATRLNFYVFDAATADTNAQSTNITLGEGTFPWDAKALSNTGGFIVDNDAFGGTGRTATHEIGHNLGLWHPFRGVEEVDNGCGDNCREKAGVANQDTVGDYASDTPPTPTSFDCANAPGVDGCNGAAWGNTDFKNFMGYADDSCIDHFTPQQMGRMHAWINEKLTGWVVNDTPADTIAPSISIGTPANNATISALPNISGNANDNTGITRVDLYLQRKSDNKYWNGTLWIPQVTVLTTTITGNTWGRTAGLPSGANLASGAYFTAARAFDAANNGTSTTANFTISVVSSDTTPPAINIAVPTNNASVSALPSISGTASDNTGVTRVDLYLQRKSDNKWWNGTIWAPNAVALTTVLNGFAPRNWSRTAGLPSGANLASGAYFTAARAFDAANNGTSAIANFSVSAASNDTIAPTINIAVPTNNASVSALPSISGTASDNTGVTRVDLYLQRKSDNKWWNGTAWTPNIAVLTTSLNGNNWSRTAGLPSGANLASGAYFTAARAFDAANNGTSAIANFSVSAASNDTIAPTITLQSPENGATYSEPISANGAVADAGGSGINRVVVYLRRNSDMKWWNGSEWLVAATPLNATLTTSAGQTQWDASEQLPQGEDLNEGQYLLGALATDGAGNNSLNPTATFTFSVGVSSAAVASNVALSSARAATDGTILLSFTGAVRASQNIEVSVNGAPRAGQNVSQASAASIQIEVGTLVAGARVSVNYKIQDTQGRNVSGTAIVAVK